MNDIIECIEYRGFTVNVHYDDLTNQFYTTDWPKENSEPLYFGINNNDYKTDIFLLINNILDTIYVFPYNSKYAGARLEQFQNGAFRDIRLIYKDRILKIYIYTQQWKDAKSLTKEQINSLISDSITILDEIIS